MCAGGGALARYIDICSFLGETIDSRIRSASKNQYPLLSLPLPELLPDLPLKTLLARQSLLANQAGFGKAHQTADSGT